jgi:predicted porin
MNIKYTAIALAVAGTVAAPMAAQAEVYASARVGLVNTDTGGVSELRVRSLASRFGLKSETDLGNGMTGFGKYEWDVDLEGADSVKLRQRIVGLKGDFGSVTLGQAYHTFYNFVVGPTDNPWWGSGYAMVSYTGRTGDAITYAGGAGDISFGVTGYLNGGGEEGLDGTEFGASFGIGGMTLGVAVQDLEVNADAATGVALTGIPAGDVSLGIGFQTRGDDSSVLVDAGFGNAYVHFESLDIDGGAAPTSLTVGYTQSLGRKTTAWYEFQTVDADTADSDDDMTALRAMLKYDIM